MSTLKDNATQHLKIALSFQVFIITTRHLLVVLTSSLHPTVDFDSTIMLIVLSIRRYSVERKEALEQIESITRILEASNRMAFSPALMVAFGILTGLIPVIELSTQWLTFGFDFGPAKSYLIPLIHTGFYWTLYHFVGNWVKRVFNGGDQKKLHPLIRQAFSISQPIVVAILGTIFVLIPTGNGALVFPIVYLFLGILFNMYGRFSVPAIRYISWSYIVLGLVYAYLVQYQIPNLWMVFTSYLGLSYIAMGLLSRKKGASGAEVC